MTPADMPSENYDGAFAGKLEIGDNVALIVVDLVNAYLTPGSPLYCPGSEAVTGANHQLVAAARQGGAPIIFTNVEYQIGGADGGVFYRKVPALKLFETGSALGEFPDGLDVRPGEVITKQYPSAFFSTGLADRLRTAGVDTVMISGFSTSGCVRASALDAIQEGFVPFVVKDACGDRDRAPHDANLFDIQAKIGEVVGLAEALAILGG